jgi:hypothetical protein
MIQKFIQEVAPSEASIPFQSRPHPVEKGCWGVGLRQEIHTFIEHSTLTRNFVGVPGYEEHSNAWPLLLDSFSKLASVHRHDHIGYQKIEAPPMASKELHRLQAIGSQEQLVAS